MPGPDRLSALRQILTFDVSLSYVPRCLLCLSLRPGCGSFFCLFCEAVTFKFADQLIVTFFAEDFAKNRESRRPQSSFPPFIEPLPFGILSLRLSTSCGQRTPFVGLRTLRAFFFPFPLQQVLRGLPKCLDPSTLT